MIVIDVGCANHGGESYSIERLVEEFQPAVLFGFDPLEPLGGARQIDQTNVFVNPSNVGVAAWVFDGEIGFSGTGSIAHIDESDAPMTGLHRKVPCFDLAKFIRSLPADQELVLKLDCEGAEYSLLEHLIDTRTDELLKLAWVEWHDAMGGISLRRRGIEADLSCELREWEW